MTNGYVAGCFSCDQDRLGPMAPASERIWASELWRLAHAVRGALPGWLILLPRRHVEAMADLTDAEAAELGTLQVVASRALHEVTGCAKTYVVQFAEATGFAHVHIHVIPRAVDLPAERIGPGVFGYLERPESEWVTQSAIDGLTDAMVPVVARMMSV